jgi:hypothetical protein
MLRLAQQDAGDLQPLVSDANTALGKSGGGPGPVRLDLCCVYSHGRQL